MTIMVGCPAYKREWILPAWFDAVEVAFAAAGEVPHYAFVLDMNDSDTVDVVFERGNADLQVTFCDQQTEVDQRTWNHGRYAEMANYRNALLRMVRQSEPDYFLSLDSDILIQEQALVNLLESIYDYDAVGGKLFMTPMVQELPDVMPNKAVPSWANVKSTGDLERYDADGVFRVQVIMAMKLMEPQAYNVDYVGSDHGEDIGWSQNCTKNGLKLGWDGRITNKHVMEKWMLDLVDPRCGY